MIWGQVRDKIKHMPGILSDVPVQPAPLEPPGRRWTRSDCEVLETSGLLDHERLELVEGELISKTGKNRTHSITVGLLRNWLAAIFGLLLVETGVPIDVAPQDNHSNEPEPDATVLTRDFRMFAANPQPADLQLVVEVSDSTLTIDLTAKARLYARAGIVEYWVIDIRGRRLMVHHDPGEGVYSSVMVYGEFETVSPLAVPEAWFRVADVLPALTAS